jgi:hypothetical protein
MKKYTINITEVNFRVGSFKVALSDHNNNMNVVYERSLQDALKYAKTWCEEAEERQHAKDVMNKAILESIALDRIAGITTSTRDSLD